MKKLALSIIFLFSFFAVHAQNDRTEVLQNLEKGDASRQEIKLNATLKSASRLFGEKDDLTTVITIIPSGSVVEVIGSDSTYYHVIYNEDEGYILKRHAVLNDTTVAQNPQSQHDESNMIQQNIPSGEQEQQAPQVSRFTYLENKYGTSMASLLIAGKIWKGMTSEMVRDSWGRPQKINRVISGNTVKEEWIYKNTWLYIQDDILSEWGPIR